MSLASTPANPGNVDLNKVSVILTPYSTTTFMPGTPQTFTLQSLLDANGGTPISYPASLLAGSKEEFNIQIAMDGDAASGSSVNLSNIDLAFTGSASTNN